jgi:5S rRNA maturation endonuclease (ribonuclease M5)
MSSEDYSAIKSLIDDIIGIDTKQGNNLKKAIKNYFDTKPVSVKLVAKNNMSFNINGILKHREAADKAMKRYTEKLNEDIDKLKQQGEYCGVGG